MSPFVKKLIVAVVFGVGAAAPVVNQAVADGSISTGEWQSIGVAFAVAAWGAFKSNTTVLAPSRPGESAFQTGPGMGKPIKR